MADSLTTQVASICDHMKMSTDWTAIMALCDEANNVGDNPPVLAEMVRAVRKNLQASDMPRSVIQALTLAEALVKNCRMPVHREMASDKFMASLKKLVLRNQNRRNTYLVACAHTMQKHEKASQCCHDHHSATLTPGIRPCQARAVSFQTLQRPQARVTARIDSVKHCEPNRFQLPLS